MRIKSLRLCIWRRCEMAMRMAKLIATAVQTAAAELTLWGHDRNEMRLKKMGTL